MKESAIACFESVHYRVTIIVPPWRAGIVENVPVEGGDPRRADGHFQGQIMYVASKRLTLAGAKKMMATAVAMAEEAGIAISVALVQAAVT